MNDVGILKIDSLEGHFFAVDSKAIGSQQQLVFCQKRGLIVAVLSIFLLATFAFVMHTSAPQVLCPVAVFLMIRYLDRLRKSELTFQFASFRLTAETLRVMGAVRNKPALLEFICATRSLSTHTVADESAKACGQCAGVLRGEASTVKDPSIAGYWNNWLTEQTEYYARASNRERLRGRRALSVFNTAFTFVAVVGGAASVWSLVDLSATSSVWFRALMAVASVVGSCGLAYISFVRDRKAFDQSFDYERMHQVLSGTINSRVRDRTGDVFERMVVTETLNEHMRWALRMAGHFKTQNASHG